MNRAFGLTLPAVVTSVLAVCVSNCRAEDVYYVSEIIRVLSPVSFECRLRNFPYAPQARYRVSLADAAAGRRPQEESIAVFEHALRSAERIELRDVKTRNYFRIEAHVWADGKDVAKDLIADKFIAEAKTEKAAPNNDVQRTVDRPQPQPPPTNKPVPVPVNYAPYDLGQLVRTEVDLSTLRAETPLAEALQIISDSLQPRLPIVVFWSDLENNALVDRETPIGVEGFGRISAAMGLDAVLYSVSGYGVPLKFTIDGGILKIGTMASLSQKTTKVYSVLDLVSPPAYDTSESGYGSGNSGSGTVGGYSGAR